MPKGLINRLSLFLMMLVVVAELLAIIQPLPALKPIEQTRLSIPAEDVSLPWPEVGQSALGAQGFGLLALSGEQKPAPIASVGKVITALAVLQHKPLAPTEQGPTITLTSADVEKYRSYVSQDGSVVPVADGEQITERQALEAMLLPSANNMAYTLATWAFGSLDNYNAYANNMLRKMGLNQTTVTDASGFSAGTMSTARDLMLLAQATMNQPTMADIVAQEEAVIPVAGTVKNTNWLLGTDGIIGIKTGNTDEAGGCFMFAAKRNVLGQSITVVGAVMNAPSLAESMASARALVTASDNGFAFTQTIKPAQVVGRYASTWGTSVNAISKAELSMLVWRGQNTVVSVNLNQLPANAKAGASAGIVSAKSGLRTTAGPVITKSAVIKPSLKWRLLHP